MYIKIAIIIATPDPFNSGMMSVDLSAIRLFDKYNYEYDILCTQIYTRNDSYKGLVKTLSDVNALYEYTHVIFWGDFINNPMYGMKDFSSRDVRQELSTNSNNAFDRWINLFTLDNHELRKCNIKVAAIGGNFHFNFDTLMAKHEGKIENLQDKWHIIFRKLQENFDLILPRDMYSLMNLTNNFQAKNFHKLNWGMDCAFLLRGASPSIPKCNSAYYYFYRSKISSDMIQQIMENVRSKYSIQTCINDSWLKGCSENMIENLELARNIMANSLFVITDTYHFAINCITEGTIAICIRNKTGSQRGTLGDFKKYALYEQLGFLSLHVENSDDDLCGKVIDKVDYVLKNYDAITQKISYINNEMLLRVRAEIVSNKNNLNYT